jgi:hypothetical protein
MRHSWKLLADFLGEQNLTYADVLTPKANMIAANFKAHAEAAGVKGLEALFTHTNILMEVFREGSSVLDKLLNRATRRRHPRQARKYSTMWYIQKLLRFVGERMPNNRRLSSADLLGKTLLLTMIFSACRITELTKLTSDPSGIRSNMIRLSANVNTRLEELRWITIWSIANKSICPLNAIRELLRRRRSQTTYSRFLNRDIF